jgi:hypothetical protein
MTDTEFKNTTKAKLREELERTRKLRDESVEKKQAAQFALQTAEARFEKAQRDQERLKIVRELIMAYINAAYPMEPTGEEDRYGNPIYNQASDVTSRFLGEVLRVLNR